MFAIRGKSKDHPEPIPQEPEEDCRSVQMLNILGEPSLCVPMWNIGSSSSSISLAKVAGAARQQPPDVKIASSIGPLPVREASKTAAAELAARGSGKVAASLSPAVVAGSWPIESARWCRPTLSMGSAFNAALGTLLQSRIQALRPFCESCIGGKLPTQSVSYKPSMSRPCALAHNSSKAKRVAMTGDCSRISRLALPTSSPNNIKSSTQSFSYNCSVSRP
mmetsp:Transcript_18477/g.48629  ORF Transcript_18477/g.48629 Transcript_18477/m.48629 type:complete len:221 (-) Transcript_18477:51-713(-)